ncbi:MAG: penicillin-binding protein activator, partial [Pseudomonadota bacterium]
MMLSKYVLLLVMLALLGACAVSPTADKAPPADELAAAETLFAQRKYDEAANEFNRLSQSAEGRERQILMLRVAATLARAENLHQAKQVYRAATIDPYDAQLSVLSLLADAHITLSEREPEMVLRLLDEPLPDSVPPVRRAEYHQLRADAWTMLGNRLDSAHDLVMRENYLDDDELIALNQQAIWISLATLTERTLEQLRTAPPPDVLSGWMHLVRIAKTYQLRPALLRDEVAMWRQQYPDHPADDALLEGLTTRSEAEVAYPDRVALLLPLSGRFAKAAEAVRDGFLAAYYAHQPVAQQAVRVYDAGDDPFNIDVVYQQALDDGAQFVVGPLDKDALSLLAQRESLTVPTLALNYIGEEERAIANLYQFGLSPEAEARQVAERTWLDGHVNAAALVPAGPWGERVLQAFVERWQQLGGNVVEVQTYRPSDTDFSVPIRMLLNLDDSKRRHRAITTIFKRNLEYTPRRRQDVDFIFLAAYPRQARQIRPQLKFYHAAYVPVYATSHIFTGNLNTEKDRDMDGVVFGDMPWVLTET